MSVLERDIAVFDLETTGVDVRTARIVTACVAVLDASGALVTRHDWLADPGVEIPAGASAIHGITTERARAEGQAAAQVVSEIVAALHQQVAVGRPIVVYNAPYDLTLLAYEAVRYGIEPLRDPAPIIDPLVIDKQTFRFRRGRRTLDVVAADYGVALDTAHDAGADAIAAGQLAQAMVTRHAAQLPRTVAELHAAQVQWFDQQADDFEDFMRRERDHRFTADRGWPLRVERPPLGR